MFLCEPCHRKDGCPVEHCMVSYGPCEKCGKTAECSDCLSRNPVRAEGIKRYDAKDVNLKKSQNEIYRSTKPIEYPARRKRDHGGS
jgi:hypothetical protein